MPNPEEEQPYLTPKEVARFDPYGVRKQALAKEAESLESQTPEPTPEEAVERPDIIEASEIMKDDFFGPEEIGKAFQVELDPNEIPAQPFSREELKHFQQEGYFLSLRIDHDKDGKPLTIQQLKSLYELDPKDQAVRIFYQQDWYEKPENSDPFYTTQIPKVQWALTKKEILPDSTSKTHQDQETLLNQYTQQQSPHLESDHTIQRREAVDIAYDLALAYLSKGQKQLPTRYDWSKTQLTQGAVSGFFAPLGHFDARGFVVHAVRTGDSDGDLGVCPSVVSEIET
ncbi:MAG TPA: hypothetical protein VJJ80_01785 [Patescibacteria group bacterium]|nr:hypothetical protein [Patescibacteria group bacterium]